MQDARLVNVGEVRLNVVSEGEGPPVLLLHGFPEFSYSWRAVQPALAAAGYRAVAPDLRGYNLSDKPAGVAAYAMDRLVADVVGLVKALGAPRVKLVGHDWGGVIAWHVAARHPELVERLAVLNAPHPKVFVRRLFTSRQALKSWYMLFFQLPALPERRLVEASIIRRTFRGLAVDQGAFPDEVIDRYLEAIRRPGAATAALNYYRAALRPESLRGPMTIAAPTLVLWGMKDTALVPANLDGLERYVPDLRVERIAGAGHWIQHDAPALVAEKLVAFFRETSVPERPDRSVA